MQPGGQRLEHVQATLDMLILRTLHWGPNALIAVVTNSVYLAGTRRASRIVGITAPEAA